MTHYLKRIVTLTDSLDVTPEGLGYDYWLLASHSFSPTFLNAAVSPDGIVNSVSGFDIHVHPFIKATALHAEALGVEVGQAIAGIRWVDKVDTGSHRHGHDPGPGVSFDRHLARLEADAEAVEADRTEPDTGELVRRQAEAEADTRDDEELEAAGDILADVVDRSPGVKVRCKSCDARFDTHAEFEGHGCD